MAIKGPRRTGGFFRYRGVRQHLSPVSARRRSVARDECRGILHEDGRDDFPNRAGQLIRDEPKEETSRRKQGLTTLESSAPRRTITFIDSFARNNDDIHYRVLL